MGTVEGKKQEKRRALLEAAYDLFLERGAAKTSVEDITSRAKVAKGTFYLYFQDKGAVMQALLGRVSYQLLSDACLAVEQHPELPDFTAQVVFVIDHIIEALRQVDVPNYRALILRKTFPQLRELIDKTMQYYKPVFPKARYNASNHCWTFPSGAKIYFGSMFRAQDKYNYQGQQFDFIGVDELTHFTWEEYSYLMSRNRPSGPGTQVYIRATANPGGIGHGWVKARFITPAPPGTRMVQLVDVKKPDGTVIYVKAKKGVLLAAIARENKIIIPGGLTTIQEGDHVVVVTKSQVFDDLTDILA